MSVCSEHLEKAGPACRTCKKITNLRWDETSGVDHSANNEEGWAVIKCVSRTASHEETNMSKDDDDKEFLAWKTRIEAILESLPTDDDRERFLQILAQLAGKVDEATVNKRRITKSVLERVVNTLDGMAQQEQWAGLLSKALQKGQDLQDEEDGAPAGVDEDYRQMVEVVEGAIKRAAGGVPQKGLEIMPGSRERMVVDTMREVAAEDAMMGGPSTPDSLRKFKQGDVSEGDKRTDWAKALLKETLAYRDWLVSTAESAEEAKAVKARMQPLIDQYQAWADGKYKDGRY
jgi:hypothetical protein